MENTQSIRNKELGSKSTTYPNPPTLLHNVTWDSHSCSYYRYRDKDRYIHTLSLYLSTHPLSPLFPPSCPLRGLTHVRLMFCHWDYMPIFCTVCILSQGIIIPYCLKLVILLSQPLRKLELWTVPPGLAGADFLYFVSLGVSLGV